MRSEICKLAAMSVAIAVILIGPVSSSLSNSVPMRALDVAFGSDCEPATSTPVQKVRGG